MTIPLFAADRDVELGPEPDRDSWCTGPRLRDLLMRMTDGKPVDLDPATNERSIIPAVTRWTRADAPTADPIRPWFGTVWNNWPWSDPEPWTRACAEEAAAGNVEWIIGCGICDPSVGWFQHCWRAAAICFPAQREQFDPPPGAAKSSNMHPIALPLWVPWAAVAKRNMVVAKFRTTYRDLGKVVVL